LKNSAAIQTKESQNRDQDFLKLTAILLAIDSLCSLFNMKRLCFLHALFAVAAAIPIILDDASKAVKFGGVGGISGGGATSRLFFDYPEPSRSKLLDLLWKPQYGAAMQHSKVEIPADADTTCGSEVAHRHDAADGGACNRGYEGWFLSEAATRVPGITSSSLQWAAPRFVGDSGISNGSSLFTQTNIDQYVIPWLKCMRDTYNVSLTYQGGGWNEKVRVCLPRSTDVLIRPFARCRGAAPQQHLH
jgi:hypothetical protein